MRFVFTTRCGGVGDGSGAGEGAAVPLLVNFQLTRKPASVAVSQEDSATVMRRKSVAGCFMRHRLTARGGLDKQIIPSQVAQIILPTNRFVGR